MIVPNPKNKDILQGSVASEYLQTILDRLKTYPNTNFADAEYEKRISETLDLINWKGEQPYASKRNTSEDEDGTSLEAD